MPGFLPNQLPLAPLGAGDLIDRAVRLYRRHLLTLLGIAAPPVLVTAAGTILGGIAWRELFVTPGGASLIAYVLLGVMSLVLIFGGHIFSMIVMGGAARNLVTHLLWDEPVSMRSTYSAVRARFWGLLGASLIIVAWVGLSFSVSIFGWYSVGVLVMTGSFLLALIAPWLAAVCGIIGFIFSFGISLWLFFFMVGRIVYVPQVMLVEGKRVFESVGRSFALARGNVRRLMAMTLFIMFATYSALMILVVPLGWYGYLNGIDPSPFSTEPWPAWYTIGYSVFEPLSSILLAPVWMLGLSLMYVDERIRHEGYDVELLASRHLGELPKLGIQSPLGTALSVEPGPPANSSFDSSGKILKLS
jgi:hypothetical protein